MDDPTPEHDVVVDEPADPTVHLVDFSGPYTLDEIANVEQLTELPMARWFDGDSPEGELRKVLAWTLASRVNPDADLATFGQLMIRVGT